MRDTLLISVNFSIGVSLQMSLLDESIDTKRRMERNTWDLANRQTLFFFCLNYSWTLISCSRVGGRVRREESCASFVQIDMQWEPVESWEAPHPFHGKRKRSTQRPQPESNHEVMACSCATNDRWVRRQANRSFNKTNGWKRRGWSATSETYKWC